MSEILADEMADVGDEVIDAHIPFTTEWNTYLHWLTVADVRKVLIQACNNTRLRYKAKMVYINMVHTWLDRIAVLSNLDSTDLVMLEFDIAMIELIPALTSTDTNLPEWIPMKSSLRSAVYFFITRAVGPERERSLQGRFSTEQKKTIKVEEDHKHSRGLHATIFGGGK